MMKRGMILTVVLAVLMMGVSAYAMPVNVNNGTFSTTAISVKDDSEYALDTNAFQLMGTDSDGSFLVYADEQYLKVNPSAISGIIAALNPEEALPSIADYSELSRGSRGDSVLRLQENLIALGYLSGTADGDYGKMSESAVNRAQEALGMEETGTADPMLQMLLASMTAQAMSCTVTDDPMAPFEAIAGKTNVDLEGIIQSDMTLTYDDISGVGMIKNGAVVTYTSDAYSDIDKHTFTLEFGLKVSQGSDGIVNVNPAVEVKCVGVQRPTMQSLIFKSGDERYTVTVEALRNSLSGLNAVEEASVDLNAEAAQMLANVAEEGELKVRIACKYDSYDIVVPADTLEKIAAIGQAGVSAIQ